MNPHPESRPTNTPATSGAWTPDRIRALGTVTDIPTTAAIFGLSRSVAYDLARTGRLPVPVLRFGTRYRIPVAAILSALHLPADPGRGDDLISSPGHASIVRTQSPDDAIPPTPPHDKGRRHG